MSCTHGGIRFEDLDLPLTEIQKAVVDGLPLGKRAISENSREIFSEYFVMIENKPRPAGRLKVRYYAHIYILGDRRPYQVEGLVRKQVKESIEGIHDYADAGIDEELTKIVMANVKAKLIKSRDERNIVDDFRVF